MSVGKFLGTVLGQYTVGGTLTLAAYGAILYGVPVLIWALGGLSPDFLVSNALMACGLLAFSITGLFLTIWVALWIALSLGTLPKMERVD